MDEFDWLVSVLSRSGALGPEEAEGAVRAGRVRVNGKAQTRPMFALRPQDLVELDGRPVPTEGRTVVAMLHKPRAAVSSSVDAQGRPTVFDVFRAAMPEEWPRFRWHAVGRLDLNTTGLLLFTNDEKLLSHVSSPRSHLPKRYVAQVSGNATPALIRRLAEGIALEDGPARPAHARLRAPNVVELTLTEGRYHQVKRMLGALRLPVLALHREAIGDLSLDVPEGAARLLTDAEVRERLHYPAADKPQSRMK